MDELHAAVTDAVGTTTDRNDAISATDLVIPDVFVCASTAIQHVLRTVAVVAPSKAAVLVTGESGVGKERVVEAIHASSGRAAGPLVAANCASFPETLIESELFGHAKGAFTGAATPRQGLFRAADGGTLLLDEIGELPVNLQPKLLRVLETGQFFPVGSEATVQIDTRLVAATNRDLEAAVREGAFREDLYYRINVIELHVPPLRERRADIVARGEECAMMDQSAMARRVAAARQSG